MPRAKATQGGKSNNNNSSNFKRSTLFASEYTAHCANANLIPLASILTPGLESDRVLLIDVDKFIKVDSWTPLLLALRAKLTKSPWNSVTPASDSLPVSKEGQGLRSVAVYSNLSSGTEDESTLTGSLRKACIWNETHKSLVGKLVRSLEICMSQNQLSSLSLHGIRLSPANFAILNGALNQTPLAHLSLARTRIGNEGLSIMASTLKTAKHLAHLDLSDCGLTSGAGPILASILKSSYINREAFLFNYRLRYSQIPESTALAATPSSRQASTQLGEGLHRLSLCCNALTDKDIEGMEDILTEPIGLLALDLQFNQLTHITGLLRARKANSQLAIIDVRNNVGIAESEMAALTHLLKSGASGCGLDWLDVKNPLKASFIVPPTGHAVHALSKPGNLSRKSTSSLIRPSGSAANTGKPRGPSAVKRAERSLSAPSTRTATIKAKSSTLGVARKRPTPSYTYSTLLSATNTHGRPLSSKLSKMSNKESIKKASIHSPFSNPPKLSLKSDVVKSTVMPATHHDQELHLLLDLVESSLMSFQTIISSLEKADSKRKARKAAKKVAATLVSASAKLGKQHGKSQVTHGKKTSSKQEVARQVDWVAQISQDMDERFLPELEKKYTLASTAFPKDWLVDLDDLFPTRAASPVNEYRQIMKLADMPLEHARMGECTQSEWFLAPVEVATDRAVKENR